MAEFDLILMQLDKERFTPSANKWMKGEHLYEDNDQPSSKSNITKQLDWKTISDQLDRKKLNESTLSDRIADVSTRLFKKDYK